MPPVQSFLNLESSSTGQNNKALLLPIYQLCMCFCRLGKSGKLDIF